LGDQVTDTCIAVDEIYNAVQINVVVVVIVVVVSGLFTQPVKTIPGYFCYDLPKSSE